MAGQAQRYQQEDCASQVEGITYLEQMKYNKTRLEAQLAHVNQCIEALEKNPEIERVLSLLQKNVY